jgi:hypothetical protein
MESEMINQTQRAIIFLVAALISLDTFIAIGEKASGILR